MSAKEQYNKAYSDYRKWSQSVSKADDPNQTPYTYTNFCDDTETIPFPIRMAAIKSYTGRTTYPRIEGYFQLLMILKRLP